MVKEYLGIFSEIFEKKCHQREEQNLFRNSHPRTHPTNEDFNFTFISIVKTIHRDALLCILCIQIGNDGITSRKDTRSVVNRRVVNLMTLSSTHCAYKSVEEENLENKFLHHRERRSTLSEHHIPFEIERSSILWIFLSNLRSNLFPRFPIRESSSHLRRKWIGIEFTLKWTSCSIYFESAISMNI